MKTGYNDSKGSPISEGDRLSGSFAAPWDEEVPITLYFRVEHRNGDWWAAGEQTNYEDGFLKNFKNLKIVTP